MKKRTFVLLAGALLLLLTSSGCDLGTVAGSNAGGSSRELNGTTKDGGYAPFKDFLGKTTSEINVKTNDAWDYFIGARNEDSRIFYDNYNGDQSMAYIVDNGADPRDIRSEGMSYGMMIAVQLGKQNSFNKLWKFAREKMMNVPPHPLEGMLRWHIKEDGTPFGGTEDNAPAPDGDIYYAMALLLAQNRWGGHYADAAWFSMERMLNAIPSSGDMGPFDNNETSFFTDSNIVKHWPKNPGSTTNPSYHLPAFFKFFAEHPIYKEQYRDKFGSRKRWKAIAKASRSFLKSAAMRSPYMLTANTTNEDGYPVAYGKQSDHYECYRYDAWRVAMNITLDADWNGIANWGGSRSPSGYQYWVCTYSSKLCNFFESKNSDGQRDYQDQWKTNGSAYTHHGTDHSAGHVAMNAMAACLMKDTNSNNEMRDRYLQELWDIEPSSVKNYYNICLYTLAIIWATGNYNLYQEDQ